jgi:hypothetical protein
MKKGANRNHKKNRTSFIPELRLPGKTGRWSAGIILIAAGLMLTLGFFESGGFVGNSLSRMFLTAIGGAAYALPIVLLSAGGVFFAGRQERLTGPLFFASVLFLASLGGLLADFSLGEGQAGSGGYCYYFAQILANLFEKWVAAIVFAAGMLIAVSVFWWLFGQPLPDLSKMWLERKERKKIDKLNYLIFSLVK